MIAAEDIIKGSCFSNGVDPSIREVTMVKDDIVHYTLHQIRRTGYEQIRCAELFNIFLSMYAVETAHCFINEKGELEML